MPNNKINSALGDALKNAFNKPKDMNQEEYQRREERADADVQHEHLPEKTDPYKNFANKATGKNYK